MTKLDITHMVPNFLLNDQNGWAIAKAIEAALQYFYEKVEGGISTALDPDKMPEWRLDELAEDENLFWYDFDATLDAKRETVKNARSIYATLGTKAGVERAARNYADDARVEEWFSYGGNPAYFRLYTRNPSAGENIHAMINSVNSVKRLSSVLESIYIDHIPAQRNLYAGCGLHISSNVKYTVEDTEKEETT